MTATPAPMYLSLFRERQALCHALTELSKEQQMLIEDDRYDDLVGLLGHKQQMLDRLTTDAREKATIWQAWISDRERLPTDQRRACDEVLRQIEATLQDLLHIEQRGAAVLSQRRETTLHELQQVSAAEQTLQTYQPSGTGPPQLFDITT